MNINTFADLIQGTFAFQIKDAEKIEWGYVSDLLSLVMANGKKGTAWITVQNHLNVIAVAALLEMACIVLVEGITLDEGVKEKAEEEKIPVIYTKLSAYDVCVLMGKAQIQGVK